MSICSALAVWWALKNVIGFQNSFQLIEVKIEQVSSTSHVELGNEILTKPFTCDYISIPIKIKGL